MTTTIERPFTISGSKTPHVEDRKVVILIEPGRVRLPGGVTNLHWHDAERLSVHLKEAASAARVLMELKEQNVVDIRRVCTVCNEVIRDGVVTSQGGEDGRQRHVVGSPECRR